MFSLPAKEVVMPKIKKYIKANSEDKPSNYRK